VCVCVCLASYLLFVCVSVIRVCVCHMCICVSACVSICRSHVRVCVCHLSCVCFSVYVVYVSGNYQSDLHNQLVCGSYSEKVGASSSTNYCNLIEELLHL